MQAGVDKWEAAGFLGMSIQMLARVYGHHHPDYLRSAARSIGYRPRQSLPISLPVARPAPPDIQQAIESIGGGRSRMRTGLHLKFPANREINRQFRQIRPFAAIPARDWRANSMACRLIPYLTEQGILAGATGISCGRIGKYGCCHRSCSRFEISAMLCAHSNLSRADKCR
jgi:hypothetical protein